MQHFGEPHDSMSLFFVKRSRSSNSKDGVCIESIRIMRSMRTFFEGRSMYKVYPDHENCERVFHHQDEAVQTPQESSCRACGPRILNIAISFLNPRDKNFLLRCPTCRARKCLQKRFQVDKKINKTGYGII